MNFFQGNLFTEYFLTEGIKHSHEWNELEKIDFNSFFKEFEDIYLKISSAQNPDEADTEDTLVISFFEKLGFEYLRNKSPQQRRRQDIPDFILFKDDKDKAEGLKNKAKQWHIGKAILEAKRFKRALDRRDVHAPFDQSVPSNQILRYLSSVETASYGKILWGILTNGQIWRLYYQKARSRIDDFLGVDLSKIFTNGLSDEERVNSFKIFYLFFRKVAFETTDYRQEKTFLEYALEEGKNWEERVSESLKDKVFTDVFPILAEGFLQDVKSKGEIINRELLDNIYNNTLILLYRILFVLYAEDRDLLPVRKPKYDDYSLRKLRKEIEIRIDNKDIFSRTASNFYGHLKNLFKIINWGDRELGTPPYNGGLFDPQTHSFLEKYDVADYYIAHTIDYLSRDHSITPAKRINYRDLTVRQLGSIYEGLLEFKLEIADEDLSVIREKGNEKYISKRELAGQKILGEKKRGELYITNEKAARKATGSYYTPDYIVQYIVENTIGPLVKEKIQNFDSKKAELKSSAKFRGQTAKWKTKELKKFDPAEAILNIKILDPAMGSGHFLVGAVDYLADRVLEILDQYSQKVYFGKETYISPLISRLGDIRTKVLEQARKAGYEIEHEKLEDKHIIKRIILKRCIYGVDLNALAVELAKVSLWLHSFTIGAPLSFLDHHLKCGNSLIGVWDVSDVILPSSPRYQYFLQALKNMVHIQNIYDISLKETQESARYYIDFEKKLYPFVRKFNVSLAAKHFMKKITPNSIIGMEHKALDESSTLPPLIESKYKEAISIANRKRFFHWKLEFPEVWYEAGREKANGGFDAIIGNPPYKRTKYLIEDQSVYNEFYETAFGAYDIYILFIEKSLSLLSSAGYFSFIVSNKFIIDDYGSKLRNLLTEKYRVHQLIDLTECPSVFRDALVSPLVIVTSSIQTNYVNIAIFKQDMPEKIVDLPHLFSLNQDIIENNFVAIDRRPIHELKHPQTGHFNIYLVGRKKILERKLYSTSLLMKSLRDIRTGIMGFEYWKFEPFIFDAGETPILSSYFRLLTPSLLARYQILWGIEPVDIYKKRINNPILIYEDSPLNESTINFFKSPKVVVRGTARKLTATLDRKGHALLVAVHGIECPNLTEGLFFVSLLNSKLLNWLHIVSFYSARIPQGSLRYPVSFYNNLPIPCISFVTPKAYLDKLTKEAKKLYKGYLDTGKYNNIIYFVESSLKKKHKPDPNLVKKHNADRINKDRQIPKGALWQQSDVIHDFLAFLAEQMIEYNKEKHNESKGFLNWLGNYLGLKIDEMKNKKRIKDYHNIGWDEFWKILRDNKKKIRFDITRREHVEKIKDEFDTSISKIEPLKNKIELTDKLIDQIVYKLYNLADEEIKLIEKES